MRDAVVFDGATDVRVDHLMMVTQDTRVRSLVIDRQISWADQYTQSIVVGRVGGHIFGNSELKVYLTVSAQEQAKRLGRHRANLRDARLRDQADARRLHDPARPASGALQIDTSMLDPQEVVSIIDRTLEGV
jgi:CMP/dCMP kinase